MRGRALTLIDYIAIPIIISLCLNYCSFPFFLEEALTGQREVKSMGKQWTAG